MNEIQRIEPQAVATVATPQDLLRIAVQQGADMAKLGKLMELQERWEANEARKAFVADMAEFKKNPPEIAKDQKVSFKAGSGTTEYRHASLGNVVSQVTAGLARHGFSHRWNTQQLDGGRIVVTCIITHKLGHSESTVLEASPDGSGGKNNIQAVASTVTYLERYTLLSAVGLATKDDDGDGREAGIDEAQESLSQEWVKKAADAATVIALESVWNAGCKKIDPIKQAMAYDQFKVAVSTKKKALKAQESGQ